MTHHVSPEIINDLCGHLKQDAARVRYLRDLGFKVLVTADGKPHISILNYNQVTTGQAAPITPAAAPATANVAAVLELFPTRRKPAHAQG